LTPSGPARQSTPPVAPPADPVPSGEDSAVDLPLPLDSQPVHSPRFMEVKYDPQRRAISGTFCDPDRDDRLTLTAVPDGGLGVQTWPREPVQNWVETASVLNTDNWEDGYHEVEIWHGSASDPWRFAVEVEARDAEAGAQGSLRLSLADSAGHRSDYALPVVITLAPVAPFPYGELAPDTLYAIPLQATAHVGEEVTVVVASGVPAHPFQYMNGAGLVVPDDGEYVRNSFEVGMPGGKTGSGEAADGIWAALMPRSFLLAPDEYILSSPTTAGYRRWDFNVTPLQTHPVRGARGALFAARFRFATPGRKAFAFQRGGNVVITDWGGAGIKRTYYSDDATEYFWGNIANNGQMGFANAVLIEP
jgi:hypothetical protein